MRVKRIAPENEQPTHLLAVNRHEMMALRRASEAYINDVPHERSPYYKPALGQIQTQLEDALRDI